MKCLTFSKLDPEPDSDDSDFEDDPESSGLTQEDGEEEDYESESTPSRKRRSIGDGDKQPKRRKVDEVSSLRKSSLIPFEYPERSRDQLDYLGNNARCTLRE